MKTDLLKKRAKEMRKWDLMSAIDILTKKLEENKKFWYLTYVNDPNTWECRDIETEKDLLMFKMSIYENELSWRVHANFSESWTDAEQDKQDTYELLNPSYYWY
jgi:hypothetical protein